MSDTLKVAQNRTGAGSAKELPCPQVAVIGSGYWGKNLVRNFSNLGALSVICDSHAETLRTLGEQYSQCRTVTSMPKSCGTTDSGSRDCHTGRDARDHGAGGLACR
jgi:hypothetical protein